MSTYEFIDESELPVLRDLAGEENPITCAATDEAGNLWLRADEIAKFYEMTRRNMNTHTKRNIPVGWQAYIALDGKPRPGTDPLFLNQNAVAKLAILSRKPAAQAFADEVIELGVRAKRGEVALALEIIDRQPTPVQEWITYRLEAKISNDHRNTEIANRTASREETDRVCWALSGQVNKAVTGKTAEQIRRVSGAKETRDGLSERHLIMMRYMEVTQAECMQQYEAKGEKQIKSSVQACAEEIHAFSTQQGLHQDIDLWDRTKGGQLKVPRKKDALP